MAAGFKILISSILVLALAIAWYWPSYREIATETKPSTLPWNALQPVRNVPRRIVAIGDLHGDYLNFLRVLELAQLVKIDWHNTTAEASIRRHPGLGAIGAMHDYVQTERNWTWVGGDAWCIQIGDVVDRGHDTILLYSTIEKLKTEAAVQGGRFVAIFGNHEIMNFVDDWRYVTPLDIESFGSKSARKDAWLFSGSIGKPLSQTWNVMEVVGDTIFVHAGVSERFFGSGELTTTNINKKLQQLFQKYPDGGPQLFANQHWLFDADGPVWFRGQALDDHRIMCREFVRIMHKNRVTKLVVGHTPQTSGKILHRVCYGSSGEAVFNGKTKERYQVFVVDIGISKYYGGNIGALDISFSVNSESKTVIQSISSIYLDSNRSVNLSKERFQYI